MVEDSRDFVLDFRIPEELTTHEVLAFAKTCANMCNLYARKNHDYGNSFNKGMEIIGTAYGIGRLYDKMNRIITLTNLNPFDKPQVRDESINDTLLDLACYAIMTYNYLNTDKNGTN